MSMKITLSCTKGLLKGTDFVFAQPERIVIGRANDCDVRLPGAGEGALTSRHHFQLEVDPPHLRARDLGSRNGTYVNGVKIGQRDCWQAPDDGGAVPAIYCELEEGDRIQVGTFVFRVGLEEVGSATNADEPVALAHA